MILFTNNVYVNLKKIFYQPSFVCKINIEISDFITDL